MNPDRLAPGLVLLITKGKIRAFKEQKSCPTLGRFGEAGDTVEQTSSTMHICVGLARHPHAL